jgi:two-component system chemotaxis response regulator CheY
LARKILLADDSVTAQNMGRKILADAGYEVITVNNGSAALKKIAEHKPDLIVLDVYMPGYSGLEVCQRLKEVHETSRIPVLLTVGKLEPFKPEEARRVRAEGFIVKPFEASELLSALSKLEDKIVPRAEASKSGRFARAIAAVEDSGREKNQGSEEDSGWKNRISFPSKKKAKDRHEEEQERAEEGALYNQVNRDLRTVPQAAGKAAGASADFPNDGLPKDVTLEEIAAITAAAAQVASGPHPPKIQKREENLEAHASSAPEMKAPERVEPVTQEDTPASATFADVRQQDGREEKIETQELAPTKPEEPKEAAVVAVAAPANENWQSTTSGNGAGHAAESTPPVALLVAAASAVAIAGSSRWMAVPVTTDAAEAALSLDQEMQKACTALVTPEAASFTSPPATVVATAIAETAAPVSAPPEPVAPVIAEAVSRATAHEESELGQALSAVANAPIEAVRPAVTEPTPAPEWHGTTSSSEVAREQEAGAPSSQVASPIEAAPQVFEPPVAEPVVQNEEPSPVQTEAPSNFVDECSRVNAPEPQPAAETIPAAIETPVRHEPAEGGIRGMANHRDSELAESTAAAWASWRQIRSDEPKSSQPSKAGKEEEDDEEPAPPVAQAAMAVAAGAEKRPQEAASASDPRAIASIVDSVLAELRPKIVEEISRKLGEKK